MQKVLLKGVKMKQTITMTFDELDRIIDAMLIIRKQYPVSWSDDDENALRKIRNAWYNAYEKKKGVTNHGEEKSWT